MNRGFRSGSAPTPTPPPKQASTINNNYYIRRPTVVFNDERGGPSDKSNGAQARVNNKFVIEIFFFCLSHEIRNDRFILDFNSPTKFSC
jgi:hypothetical protein